MLVVVKFQCCKASFIISVFGDIFVILSVRETPTLALFKMEKLICYIVGVTPPVLNLLTLYVVVIA